MATKIADLAVRIGADITELRRGLSQAESGVDKFKRVGANAAKAFAAAIVTATTAVSALALKGVALGDELARVAGTLGLTATEMAGLHHAARLANVETGTLDSAMQRLGKSVSEARQGSGTAAKAIRALGLDAAELARLPLSEQMLRVSDAMAGVRNQTDKLRVSSEIFGRGAGASMLNLFRQGTQAIRDQMEEAKAYGLYMDSTQTRVVTEAADSQDVLKTAFEGLSIQLGATFGPAIEDANKFLADMLQRVAAMLPKLAALAERFLGITRAVEDMGDKDIAASILQNVHAITALEGRIATIRGSASPEGNVFLGMVSDLEAEKAALQARLDALLKEKVERQKKPAETPEAAATDDGLAQSEEAAKAELELATTVAAERERLRQEEMALELDWATALAEEKDRVAQEDIFRLWEVAGEHTKAFEQRKVEMDNLDKYERQTIQQRAQNVLAGLTTITGIMGTHSKKMFEVHKKLALAQAIVSLPSAVMKAIDNGGGLPWGAIPGAITAAMGLAQINAIKSAKFDGGGGGGGAAVASGGEGGGAAPAAAGPAAGQRLLVEGLNPGSLFDSRMVREFAEKLLQHQRDGGEVMLK